MKNKNIKTPLLKPLTDEEKIILLPLLIKLFTQKNNYFLKFHQASTGILLGNQTSLFLLRLE
jgi:hypothetical protein